MVSLSLVRFRSVVMCVLVCVFHGMYYLIGIVLFRDLVSIEIKSLML